MSDLRKLIDHLQHIDKGGEFDRVRDLVTGRIVSKPVTENIGRLLGAAAGGAGLALGANWLKDKFSSDKPEAEKPGSDKPNPNAPGNISDFSSSPAVMPPAGQNSNQNPNGNGSSNIGPNDDPADPKTWPAGVKPASDFGYLDPNGMWIPTPFDVRNEKGGFNIPRNSPANKIGIPMNQYTPFLQKVKQMQDKVVYRSSSLIEQSKPVKLPNGAPQIPGYKPVDPSQFSTSSDEGKDAGPKNMYWLYAYRNGKNFILIAPMLFYNTKLSIGRHYSDWGPARGIRSDNDRVTSANGTVYVSAQDFNANDMILDVVVHVSVGAPNIGANVLKSIKI